MLMAPSPVFPMEKVLSTDGSDSRSMHNLNLKAVGLNTLAFPNEATLVAQHGVPHPLILNDSQTET